MTLLIVNLCAFANRTEKLPQHVGAMSWHHAKFHDFQACFGFTWIKEINNNFIIASRAYFLQFYIASHTIFSSKLFVVYLIFSLCFERQNGVTEGKDGVWIARTFTYSEHATSTWVSCLNLELFRVRLAFLCINWVSGHLMCIIQIWTTSTCSSAPKFVEKSHVCLWVNL